MIYALLDESGVMKEVHLKAALEVWRYCEDSARYIFGDALGDDTADAIMHELRREELTRTQIYRDVFSKNKSSFEITRALDVLERERLVRSREEGKGRQKTEVWSATTEND
jgi:DNA-binding transcriptional ArsR family regulator